MTILTSLRPVLATGILTAAMIASPTAASAAEGELLVSIDGTQYSTAEVLPVFADELRLVPGDSESAAFWVMNDSTHSGVLRLDLVDPVSDDAVLAAHVELAAAPDGTDATPIALSTAIANGSCTVLSGNSMLAPGEQVRIQVTAALSSALTDEQGASADMSFRMRAVLADAPADIVQAGTACTAPPKSDDGGRPSPDRTQGELAATGGTLPLTAAGVASAATVAGLLALLWSRRRRGGDHADI